MTLIEDSITVKPDLTILSKTYDHLPREDQKAWDMAFNKAMSMSRRQSGVQAVRVSLLSSAPLNSTMEKLRHKPLTCSFVEALHFLGVDVRSVTGFSVDYGKGMYRCPRRCCDSRSLFVDPAPDVEYFACQQCKFSGHGVEGLNAESDVMRVKASEDEQNFHFAWLLDCPNAVHNVQERPGQSRLRTWICDTKTCPVCWPHQARRKWCHYMLCMHESPVYVAKVSAPEWGTVFQRLRRADAHYIRVHEMGNETLAVFSDQPLPDGVRLRDDQISDYLWGSLLYSDPAHQITSSTVWTYGAAKSKVFEFDKQDDEWKTMIHQGTYEALLARLYKAGYITEDPAEHRGCVYSWDIPTDEVELARYHLVVGVFDPARRRLTLPDRQHLSLDKAA